MTTWREVTFDEYKELTSAGVEGIIGTKRVEPPKPKPSISGMSWRSIAPWAPSVYLVKVSEE